MTIQRIENAQGEAPTADPAPAPQPANEESLDIELARLCADLRLEQLAEHCLAQERKRTSEPDTQTQVLEARLQFQVKESAKAVAILLAVLKQSPDDVPALVLLGDCYAEMAQACEARCPDSELQPSEPTEGEEPGRTLREEISTHLNAAEAVYKKALSLDTNVDAKVALHLGNIFASLGRYQEAAKVYITAVQAWRCGVAWLGIGISLYRQERYAEAEQALNEANLLNNYNAKTWTYITLVCLKQNEGGTRSAEADTAFQHALKLDLKEPAILAEVGLAYLNADRLSLAEAACRKSLEGRDVSTTHALLARCLVAGKKIDEAKHHYARAEELALSSCEKAKVAELLKMLEGVQDEG